MKKTVLRLFYIIIFIVGITAITISSVASYAANPEYAHQISQYVVENGNSPTDGSKIKGYFSDEATSIIKVTYTCIKINNEGDDEYISVNSDGDIFINGQAITIDSIVSIGTDNDKTLQKDIVVEVKNSLNPSPLKAKYVEVVAYEWCAFVFAVHYKGTDNEDLVTYDSKIITCTSIDTGTPEVYRSGKWVKDSENIHFEIIIRSDKRNQARSKDSGLSHIQVYKGTNKIGEISNIGNTIYIYTLTVSLNDIAYYDIRAYDKAGNNVLQRVAENNKTSYNAGFESAVINALTYLEDNPLYAPYVKDNLEKAYYDYYMVIQSPTSTDSDKTKQMINTQTHLSEYARLKNLEKDNKKEWNLTITNSEYISGDVDIENADTALTNLLYGEKASINIALAIFEPSKVDKIAEMQVADVSNCKQIFSLTIKSTNNNEEYREQLYKPLQIVLPLKDYKNIKGVMSLSDEDGVYDIKLIDITEYNDYIVVNSTHSYGTISLFIDESTNSSLLWLLTVLIIPIGVFVIMIIKVKNKNKKVEKQNDEPRKKSGRSGKTIDN